MRTNKFLEKYPKLWVPKIGDKVKVIELLDWNKIPVDPNDPDWGYQIGNIGQITEIKIRYSDTLYSVKFSDSIPHYNLYHEEMAPYYDSK